MTTDDSKAALVAALRTPKVREAFHYGDWDEQAAAILAALQPGWCGHERTARLFTELSESYTEAEVKIARLKEVAVAIATQRNEAWAEIARLRAALAEVVMHLERGGDWTTMTPIVAALDVARAALAPQRVAYPRGYDHRPGCLRTHPVTGPCSALAPAPSEP